LGLPYSSYQGGSNFACPQVTEAIHKTRWIIATKAGGIPLQVRDGVDGVLVPPGDPKAIADAIYDFYSSGKDQQKTGESRGNYVARPLGGRWTDDGEGPREELFSVGNATMWHVSIFFEPIT
jgi:alpha,alpha-trehalose phosphorylase (configuration-retaining)